VNAETESPQELLDWLRATVGSSAGAFQLRLMAGAGSSSVNLVSLDGHPLYVLRLHTNHEWLRREPDLLAHEAAVLAWMSGSDLPLPRCVALHSSDPQALLMTRLGGDVVLQPTDMERWLNALARVLSRIHRYPSKGFPWHYKSWTPTDKIGIPQWSNNPGSWQLALNQRSLGAPAYEPVFIHRDFHPLNVLWANGSVSGVVDWVNGCVGPAAVDVAHCRLNLALMYSAEVADQFLRLYQSCSPGYQQHPFWDLDAVLGWLPEPFFYEPWAEFGLPRLGDDVLRARMDAYLLSILSGIS
jgi:aminoglycoside phosphotransferase (APT) family kinase protein